MKANLLLVLIAVFFAAGCGNDEIPDVIEESGTIETENVIISSRTPEVIEKMYAEEGDNVRKGDTLAVISFNKLKIQLEQARAAADAAEARLKLVREGARQEDIKSARYNMDQAEAKLKQASTNFNRVKNLYESNSVTEQKYEEAETALSVARSGYEAAKANYDKVQNISRPEEVRQAEAGYAQANASFNLLREQISDAIIVSPVNGVVAGKFMDEGETAGMLSALYKIYDLSTVKLKIYIPETQLGLVKTGQRAEITTDTYEDKVYEGRVTYISPEAEFTPKNIQTKDERTRLVFAVEITAHNPGNELKPGMPADARVFRVNDKAR